MCNGLAGAAGTPRAARRDSVLRESSYQGGIFHNPDGIRLGYE